jgi:imidazolonepropionase-like amidohydrolase
MSRPHLLPSLPLLASILAAAPVDAAQPGAGPAGAPESTALAFEGATVHLAPGRTLDSATVLISGGQIRAVGQRVAVPPGTRRIAASGMVITAGLVDVATQVGLAEVSLERTTIEGQFQPELQSIHAAYRVIDSYNPDSVAIPVARSGGVTAVVVRPRGGVITGQSAWVRLCDCPDQAVVRAPLALHAELLNGVHSAGGRGRVLEKLRELLDDARQYASRRSAFERNQTRDFAAGRLDLEALGPVLRGQLPLVIRAERAADMRAALRLAREFRIKLVIEGASEAWRLADELAAARVPVILNPTSNLPQSFDQIFVRDDNAARLAAAGVTVALSTLADPPEVRTLRQIAGIAVASGMSHRDALAAVTTAPAAIFGLAGGGRIEPGAAADIVVWSGDPFELSTRPVHIVIHGALQSLRTRQTELLERYRQLGGRGAASLAPVTEAGDLGRSTRAPGRDSAVK